MNTTCFSGDLSARLSWIAIFVPAAPWHGAMDAMLPAFTKHGLKLTGVGAGVGAGPGRGFKIGVGAGRGFTTGAGVGAGPGKGFTTGTTGAGAGFAVGAAGGSLPPLVTTGGDGGGAAPATCSPRMIANPAPCDCAFCDQVFGSESTTV